MFRTVTVYRGEKIAVKQGWLVVTSDAGEQKLPIEDIYCLVGERTATEDFLTPVDFTEL